MFVVIAAIAVVIMTCIVRVDGIQEATKANERSVRDAHQQNGNARCSPSEIGEMGLNFVMVRLFLGFFEGLDFRFAGTVCLGLFVLVLGVLVVMDSVFVSVMLDIGNTNAHRGEGEHTDGKEHAAEQDSPHPNAVFNMGFSTAHSSPST